MDTSRYEYFLNASIIIEFLILSFIIIYFLVKRRKCFLVVKTIVLIGLVILSIILTLYLNSTIELGQQIYAGFNELNVIEFGNALMDNTNKYLTVIAINILIIFIAYLLDKFVIKSN